MKRIKWFTPYELAPDDDRDYWRVERGGDEQFSVAKSDRDLADVKETVANYNARLPSFNMRQVTRLPLGEAYTSASFNEYIDAGRLAEEAWGKLKANDGDLGLTAMPYLWRRFGPPAWGTDPYKRLARWLLTTPDPKVFLDVDLCASGLVHAVGIVSPKSIWEPLVGSKAAHREWRRRAWRFYAAKHPGKPEDETKCGFSQWIMSEEGWAEAIASPDVGPQPRVDVNPDTPWRGQAEPIPRVCWAAHRAMRELLRPVAVRDVMINLFGSADEEMPPAERSWFAGLGVPLEAVAKLKDVKRER